MTEDPRDEATPAVVTDRPRLFDDEATATSELPSPAPAPSASSGPSARSARSARRGERARRRRRNWAVVGVLAVLILPFVLAGGWFVWELNPPGERRHARHGGDRAGMGHQGGR